MKKKFDMPELEVLLISCNEALMNNGSGVDPDGDDYKDDIY